VQQTVLQTDCLTSAMASTDSNCQTANTGAHEQKTHVTKRVGYIYSEELMLWHQGGMYAGHEPARVALGEGLVIEHEQHWENAAPKRRVHTVLDVSGSMDLLVHVRPLRARIDHAGLFHTERYVNFLKDMHSTQPFAKHGALVETGDCAPMGANAFPTALLSAGACLTAVENVLRGEFDAAYVLNRPPGHHATADQGMGFCILNNVALAVKALQQYVSEHRLLLDDKPLRVVIVDLDVHHGNGTQEAFYSDPNVLFISVHQQGLYPRETGYISELGDQSVPDAMGTTINIPLPPGSGNGAYMYATKTVIVPALEAFAPDVVFFSMGFDASAYDPLGNMMVSSSGFADCVTEILRACSQLPTRLPIVSNLERGGFLAATGRSPVVNASQAPSCTPRLRLPVMMCHEGGYSPILVPYAAPAVIDRLLCYVNDSLPNEESSVFEESQAEVTKTNGLSAEIVELLSRDSNLARAFEYRNPLQSSPKLYHILPLSDPFHDELSTLPLQQVQPHQRAVVDLVRDLLKVYWAKSRI